MKNLFKLFIPFILAIILSLPAWAETMQGGSPKMQGYGAANSCDFTQSFGTGLIAWYDATDASSITLNVLDVSQWNDLSSNGNHLVQATAADQPFYDTVNKLVRFDGAGERMATAAFSSALIQPVTIFAVYKIDATSGFSGVYAGLTGSANLSLESDANQLLAAGGQIFSGQDTAQRILEVTHNGVSSIAHRDGVSSGTKSLGTQGLTGLRVSSNSGGVFSNLDGYIKEVIIIDRLLATPEKNQVGNCLESKHSGTTWTDIP